MSDEELMKLLSTSQANEALTELHARYSQRVLSFFIRMFNGDTEKAQDFVQDLFVRILERHQQFDTSRKFYTWMFSIASNMAKTEFRKTPEKQISETSEPMVWDDDLQTKKEFQKALKTALAQLNESHRSVFVLRYMSHLSLNEISEVKDIPLGTVKSRLFYATKKIAQQMKAFSPSESDLFKMN